jgi:hypothetical protein
MGLPLALLCLTAALLGGCATRAIDVTPLPANPADFANWGCARIDDELDLVQQRAADVAYTVDERAGHNILALGVGLAVFWPAILAMRPDGLEAADLARWKGCFGALRGASRQQACPPVSSELPASRAAALPVAVGDRLVYEDRPGHRGAAVEWVLRVSALRRNEIEFNAESVPGGGAWRQDLAGNIAAAPPGSLRWSRLLKNELVLGQVLDGDMVVVDDDPLARARLRGQVVALGPQMVGERRFEAAVIELFGDAPGADSYTRVEGALVVDRASGVLLRLDLSSANPSFSAQRRLVRVEPLPR